MVRCEDIFKTKGAQNKLPGLCFFLSFGVGSDFRHLNVCSQSPEENDERKLAVLSSRYSHETSCCELIHATQVGKQLLSRTATLLTPPEAFIDHKVRAISQRWNETDLL